MEYENEVVEFIAQSADHKVRMLMVGGGAVNFHGYKRHSADVDFWIDTSPENINHLLEVLKSMEYDIEEIPESVQNGEQNISIKISPYQTLELITRFNPNKSFEEAWNSAEQTEISGYPVAKYRVLSLEDLIASKVKSGRPKDLLDIQELKRLRKE